MNRNMKNSRPTVRLIYFLFLTMVICTTNSSLHADVQKWIHHDLKVSVDPDNKNINVMDTIKIPIPLIEGPRESNRDIRFLLHGNLKITSFSKDINLQEIKDNAAKEKFKADFAGINTAKFEIEKKIPLKLYSLDLSKYSNQQSGTISIQLEYEGHIHHPILKAGAEYARGFSETPGIIDPEGVYLAGATFWVPWFNDDLVTFRLESSIPEPYDTVSQGQRINHQKDAGRQISTWDSPEPMDEIYFVAAKFTEYALKVGKVDVLAFLRKPDDGLANKYLETTGQYLEMYEKLIGKYPYGKFALIENFWETGYGMPSFTLLGPKVIRFPFILHSSYPHELLHNWWGNSVFVDYDAGNWCEGLTVFMADHLIKEQRGQGEEYRKTTLQGYTHYAAGKKEEFPLSKFKARYDALSSSIGYGKSMMLFRMLQIEIGKKQLIQAIQHFYKENKFKRATFDDFRKSVESVSGRDFKQFFTQWVTRVGAPELRLTNPKVTHNNDVFRLDFTIEQVQKDEPYYLKIPVAITLEGQKDAVMKILELDQRSKQYTFSFPKPPLAIDVDPGFDLFRKLHNNEIPATLSSAFGAKSVWIVLPSQAPQELLTGYRQLAETWAKESDGKIEIKMDNQVSTLPSDKAVWLMGWNNSHKETIQKGLQGFPAQFKDEAVTIMKKNLSKDSHSIVVAVKNANNPRQVVLLLSVDRTAALPGLGRKLPHYGKYSFLAFEGDEPTIMFKGQWPAVGSPLSAQLTSHKSETVTRAKIPKSQPLARLAPLFSSERLMKHVTFLASEELEGRGLGSEGIKKAEVYIAEKFKQATLKPIGNDNSYFQTWNADIAINKQQKNKTKSFELRNIIGMIPGKNPSFKDEAVVIAAHYDHLGRGWPDVHKGDEGKIHFGADDNASGVSVLLELAHTLGNSVKPERAILFVAFTAEENGLLGSAYFVDQLKKGNLGHIKKVTSIVNLDTIGRLTPKSKLMVIGSSSAREWKFIFMGIGYTVGIESQMVTQDLDASDQVNFIKAGIPGIQLFSGPHSDYHRPSDTVDKIDASGLVKVATVAKEAIIYLADRKEPLTFQGQAGTSTEETGKKAAKDSTQQTSGRRVRTGIMPDFAFTGKGVKIGFASPGSPVVKAGMQKGDIVIKVNGQVVANLREYSNMLKNFKPGDKISMTYLRDSKEQKVTIILTAR